MNKKERRGCGKKIAAVLRTHHFLLKKKRHARHSGKIQKKSPSFLDLIQHQPIT
jgi:hypothetical protein